THLYRWYQDA
ncbi:hypothetical protein D018_4344B, partial [Vibrio parahaemolyticus VP2007-007]